MEYVTVSNSFFDLVAVATGGARLTGRALVAITRQIFLNEGFDRMEYVNPTLISACLELTPSNQIFGRCPGG